MDSWPVDDRTQLAANAERKGQAKQKQKATARNYPDLGRGANTVTLVEKEGSLEWTSIATSGLQGPHLHMGKCTTIFPATRPAPDRQINTTILQSAEREANFLRTFLPDVDIPAELIRDEVSQDAAIAQKLELFDPYMGNLLAPVVTTDGTFLAFPMGELNRDINLSPFHQSGDEIVFKPSAHPTRTFDTPIRQMSVSQPSSATELQSSFLAVRTFGVTSLSEVNTSKSAPYLDEFATILPADTANRALVDVSLTTKPFQALTVTDAGSVYKCSVSSGQKHLNLIYSPIENADGSTQDSFWRLARGAHDMNYLLASNKALTQFDLRASDGVQELFSLPGQGDVLTSLQDEKDDHVVTLCSTREILWIDTRFPGKPLLGYRHGRQYDRYLDVWTSPSSPGSDASASHLGQTLFKHPLDTNTETFSFIRLTEQGRLDQVEFHVSDSRVPAFETLWTTDVKQLESKPLRSKEVPYEDQAFVEIDLSSAYDHIFRDHEQEREKVEEENANAVYDLLETIPRFWQEVEAPVEHMLTTSDVVLQAGEEPIHLARADFLSESIINSTRGYRAMAQGRLSPEKLVKGASWHYNIAPILRRFDPTPADDIQSCTKALSIYDLAEDPERPAQSLRYEKEAREQLALDLALSTDVFSTQPFSKSSDEGLGLEAMTKTLSLAGEPPALEFGYLRPRPTKYYNKDEEKEEFAASMGIRSLLKEWEIGADPEDAVFVDHYDRSAPAPQQTRRVNPLQKAGNASQPIGVQSQRPPTIVATSTVPSRAPEVGRKLFAAQSQSTIVPSLMVGYGSQIPLQDLPQSSQEYMTSTQVLPGVHGGRPGVAKKKVTKKRVVHGAGPSASPVTELYGWKKSFGVTGNKAVVCALSASYISTFAGYPLDSLKSRLQTTKTPISIPSLAGLVYREEGIMGFYRGLWIPLMTISFVRAASFTIYNRTKEHFRNHNILCRNSILDVALTGGFSGAMSGALISFTSAPFELVKVNILATIRRQLEYTIAASKGVHLVKPPGTIQAVKEIFKTNGLAGLYTGFRLHFLRDTTGTALYFLEYDGMRHLLGRKRSGEQGPTPPWLPIHPSVVPFFCGSLAGVLVKTKVQQRSLAGDRYRGVFETLHRLIRGESDTTPTSPHPKAKNLYTGPDPNAPKPLLMGIARIYRGLGVSALRSITTHGLLWTLFDLVANYIDNLPRHPEQ
ncbi:hypothetical protein FPV67DRAFT_1443423 [Lyophyllum atratum]|nr:hypothetical protein FPV67DRAFT_1443423 [Lyophyllum atratum]